MARCIKQRQRPRWIPLWLIDQTTPQYIYMAMAMCCTIDLSAPRLRSALLTNPTFAGAKRRPVRTQLAVSVMERARNAAERSGYLPT